MSNKYIQYSVEFVDGYLSATSGECGIVNLTQYVVGMSHQDNLHKCAVELIKNLKGYAQINAEILKIEVTDQDDIITLKVIGTTK